MKSTYSSRSSRRSVLKRTIAGVAGLSALGGIGGGAYLLVQEHNANAHAAGVTPNVDSVQTILNIAATAEELGVVFYTQVIENARLLHLSQAAILDLSAAQIEEQLHLQFLLKEGAKPLTNTFSFPFGKATFQVFNLFLETQQTLEAAFAAAYLAATREFALLNRSDLALVAAQIASVETEHRAVGRALGTPRPINNQAFTPVLFQTVSAAATALQRGGFLTPKRGNSFQFHPISTVFNGVVARTPAIVATTTVTPTTTTPATTTATPTTTHPAATPIKF
ncbi:MAG TPA: ferritin-like domain-containing protein [Ktedonobacteraceae bacterium]|nr:ferritin-like domain-containing protein [Ktedonobacteraceae bacterium]